jgi:hypothetical protein
VIARNERLQLLADMAAKYCAGLHRSSVAGGPDRHRGCLLCSSSVPATAGLGLRPRVFSARRPCVAEDPAMGRLSRRF